MALSCYHLYRTYNGYEGTFADFFDLFPHRWLEGNPHTLDTPFHVVLTESAARKYFGDACLAGWIA